MTRIAWWSLLAAVCLMSACGRDANFDGSGHAKQGDGKVGEGDLSAGEGTSTDGATLPSSTQVNLDGVDPKDQDYLRGCLQQWQGVNFGTKPDVKVLNAQVSVGGQGYAIDDQTITEGPALILIKAAVNVLGKSQYRFGNPHGYYCIKANVNVLAGLEVEVACQAHLASNKVGVNVGSQTDGPIAGTGVDVLSQITIKPFTPDGFTCDSATAGG